MVSKQDILELYQAGVVAVDDAVQSRTLTCETAKKIRNSLLSVLNGLENKLLTDCKKQLADIMNSIPNEEVCSKCQLAPITDCSLCNWGQYNAFCEA